MVNLEWVQHRAGAHKLYPASCDLQVAAGHTLITAYALSRPDGNWSLMLINQDQSNQHAVRIAFDNPSHQSFAGPIEMIRFGSEHYGGKSEGPNGHPDRNEPPMTKTLPASTQAITLSKASVTVLRGKGAWRYRSLLSGNRDI
jgi:hypothetical protein